ncbi:Uu.00g044180.m01.CDS01 [Anthostomella pinea]|uniref:Uu.00g044180.m01.CDS01 n=1 Tax=Anthostomella pinea TaxID=933095 RepID=A0AAI8VBV4_9PEZI|nr:Uu.00g044180.m01.CDS01 [Anthostomella pinea]
MSTLALLFLLVLQPVWASLAGAPANMSFGNSSRELYTGNSSHGVMLDSGPLFGGRWQYDDLGCGWVDNWIGWVNTECTEYNPCEDKKRLRMMSANGQDPDVWCKNFRARMMLNCGVRYHDFWNCNIGRAPELPGLRTWTYDGWANMAVQRSGVNLRFDFVEPWEHRDAMHDCVQGSIAEATCANTQWLNGNRCIPVNWRAADGSDEMDNSFVPPDSRGCIPDADVPETSR